MPGCRNGVAGARPSAGPPWLSCLQCQLCDQISTIVSRNTYNKRTEIHSCSFLCHALQRFGAHIEQHTSCTFSTAALLASYASDNRQYQVWNASHRAVTALRTGAVSEDAWPSPSICCLGHKPCQPKNVLIHERPLAGATTQALWFVERCWPAAQLQRHTTGSC